MRARARRAGAASATEELAACELSDGSTAALGEYMCACVDCTAAVAPGCQKRGWSAECGGDGPCRADTPFGGLIGTVVDGQCTTRAGAVAEFEQLCTPGAAAPR